ncbi:MAG: hypothetical protein ACM32O_20210 [Clostridia bacterium]
MEFSLDTTLLLLALGLSGYLVGHLFRTTAKSLVCPSCISYLSQPQQSRADSIRLPIHPRMLRVRRKIPLREQSGSTDDADHLHSFHY